MTFATEIEFDKCFRNRKFREFVEMGHDSLSAAPTTFRGTDPETKY